MGCVFVVWDFDFLNKMVFIALYVLSVKKLIFDDDYGKIAQEARSNSILILSWKCQLESSFNSKSLGQGKFVEYSTPWVHIHRSVQSLKRWIFSILR